MSSGLPLIGDRFPELQVSTTHGMKKLPEDYAGKWFVLFSHPGDFTPVCTTEFMAFERLREEFESLNCSLIGLSVDQVFSHIKWVEWIKENRNVDVQFPVIADELGRVSSALGMIHPGKGTNTVRSVFIVDDKGIIRLILYYPQEIGRNMDEILRALKALQTHEKHKVALPANWPNNEDLGDQVIIPPAANTKDAKARLEDAAAGKIKCWDWWFCYKEL
ncbi:MAG: peroxiredoxin [Firmicutes bacterium]|jgi:peroxiredoxin (alkyl hydroperoxide reductase subunit C)|nr:peroxiredoxin [Bacillota bacterium]